jgi:hypothetical protein
MCGAAVGHHRVRAAVRIADAVHLFYIMLTLIGFFYVYFWALLRTSMPCRVACGLRIRRTSIMRISLPGIVGAPVDYYFESPGGSS